MFSSDISLETQNFYAVKKENVTLLPFLYILT